jgi:hypothetical protein
MIRLRDTVRKTLLTPSSDCYNEMPEAGFLVWIGYVPVLKYVAFRRKGMTLEKKCP